MTSRLQFYLHDTASALRFKLGGSLSSADVADLRQCRATASSALGSRPFVVDVDKLRWVDEEGRSLLREWHEGGARIVAGSPEARRLAESITGLTPEMKTETLRDRFSWRFAAALAAALLLLLLPVTVRAETMAPASAPLPKVVLARYTAMLDRNAHEMDSRDVAVDIEASLPNLSQRGRLQAIRRWVWPGKAEYRELRLEGDRTVRQQVIGRYLKAEAQAGEMPSSSVAVSPENYKFHYVGVIGSSEAPTYIFHITPRHKRAGLIRGELWIDAASGRAVRKTGRLVKTPSVFLRHVDLVQDTDLRGDAPALRITHLEIDTRLAGRAELTIRERFSGAQETSENVLPCEAAGCTASE